MNQAILTGRMASDPDIKEFGNEGKTLTVFTIAVDKRIKKEGEKANFFRCIAFGKTGEFVGKYLAKGNKVLVSGEVNIREYEKDGEKKYITEVACDRVEGLESKPREGAGAPQEEW